MEKLKNIHPGEVLQEEFLKPLNISAYKLSKNIAIPQTRISLIIKGKRRITADTTLRLSKFLEPVQNSGLDFRMITTLNRNLSNEKLNLIPLNNIQVLLREACCGHLC